MQSFLWYFHRIRRMSPSEIAWRISGLIQTGTDRYRIALGIYPGGDVLHPLDNADPPFRVCDLPPGGWRDEMPGTEVAGWRAALIARAEKIRAHRLSFFDLEDQNIGDPIDWHKDHSLGKRAPVIFSPSIDYRDTRVAGDCKLVWEPNRHHHLVVLARAYRATGNTDYAQAVVDQLASWLDQNPFGKGMNWRSPLELGIRLINWVWALDMILESGFFQGDLRRRVLHSAYLHLWEISRKFSKGSSANNHLVGEAAGVFIGSSYFDFLPDAAKLRAEAKKILIEEISRQTYEDGCTREQAFGYHLFVIQFYLLAGLVGRMRGDEFPTWYWERIERMSDFAVALTDGGGNPPMFGDADDGYVLDLGGTIKDLYGLPEIGASLFGTDWSGRAMACREPLLWLPGEKCGSSEAGVRPVDAQLRSRAFPDSGYYLLQSGRAAAEDSISILFDCGELGYGSIAAHGHADALSFTLRAFGRDVFIDPGTYDYFTHPEWRRYFRSTRAHNTVVVDGEDQSAMLGPFMWGTRANARCLSWEPSEAGGRVEGEHDGYTRLSDPVIHRRTVELDGAGRTVAIKDHIEARQAHDLELFFHLAETCTVADAGKNRFAIDTGAGGVIIEIDPRLTAALIQGGDAPGPGWVSRGYHKKERAAAIVAHGASGRPSTFVTHISLGKPLGNPS